MRFGIFAQECQKKRDQSCFSKNNVRSIKLSIFVFRQHKKHFISLAHDYFFITINIECLLNLIFSNIENRIDDF